MNVAYNLLPIWTTNSKGNTYEGFEAVIQIWIGGKQFKFIKFGP